MKTLLIEPPRTGKNANIRILGSLGQYKGDFCWAPLDLTIIAGFLRKNGFDSEILDANVIHSDSEHVKRKVKDENPDIVIFLTSTSTIYDDLEVAKVAKEVSKNILTVAIGTHVAALPEETLQTCPDLDIVVHDPEPEISVLNLIKNNFNLKEAPGICYRIGKASIKNPIQKLSDLDVLGIPTHDKLDLSLYSDPLMKRKPMTLTYTSRGCRWSKCLYCSCPFFYHPLRLRSVSNVVEELKWLEELGVKEVKWFEPELNHNLKYTYELCDRIVKEKINLTWSADVRADILPVKLIAKMKEAGCHTLLVGVESGDSDILKAIPKGITLNQAREAVKNIKKQKLRVITHFLLGLPGETKESMLKTLEFAKELDPDATTFGIVTPHPGTGFYKFIEENNFFITRDFSKFDACLPPVYNYPQLSSEEIYDFMKYAHQNFYFRPSFLFKRAIKLRSSLEIKNALRNFLNLLERFGF